MNIKLNHRFVRRVSRSLPLIAGSLFIGVAPLVGGCDEDDSARIGRSTGRATGQALDNNAAFWKNVGNGIQDHTRNNP